MDPLMEPLKVHTWAGAQSLVVDGSMRLGVLNTSELVALLEFPLCLRVMVTV